MRLYSLSKLFDRLSFRAIRERLDKRRLQEEIDYHRLYLAVKFHAIYKGGLQGSLTSPLLVQHHESARDTAKRQEIEETKREQIQNNGKEDPYRCLEDSKEQTRGGNFQASSTSPQENVEQIKSSKEENTDIEFTSKTATEISLDLDREAQLLGLNRMKEVVGELLEDQMNQLARNLHLAFGNEALAAQQWIACTTSLKSVRTEPYGSQNSLGEKHSTISFCSNGECLNGVIAFEDSPRKKSKDDGNTNSSLSQEPIQDGTCEEIRPQSCGKEKEDTNPSLSYDFHKQFVKINGFSLRLAKSSIPDVEAGEGLFIDGVASVGQIVAIYPGVSYRPLHHRSIPGYPMVSKTNPFLLSRFDGVILDAKPWSRGLVHNGNEDHTASEYGWPQTSHNISEKALQILEGRNPLAFAHMANHPPHGSKPNVALAALDWMPSDQEPWLRVYFPCMTYPEPGDHRDEYSKIHQDTAFKSISTSLETQWLLEGMIMAKRQKTPTIVLVAMRRLVDEEIFLNYRLNPNTPLGLPSWYSPVDTVEDERRWS